MNRIVKPLMIHYIKIHLRIWPHVSMFYITECNSAFNNKYKELNYLKWVTNVCNLEEYLQKGSEAWYANLKGVSCFAQGLEMFHKTGRHKNEDVIWDSY